MSAQQKKTVQTFEDIAESDWPMLKNLEKTKFSLKTKKPSATLKEVKLVEEVIVNKATEKNIANEIIETMAEKQTQVKTETVVVPNVQSKAKESMDVATFVRLAIIGLSKLYLNKTNLMLAPLKFLMENFGKVFAGTMQFVIPAILTYLITTKVAFVANQIAVEASVIQVVYTCMFYFASMFLWISCQVISSGAMNSVKTFLTNVVKAEQNNKQ